MILSLNAGLAIPVPIDSMKLKIGKPLFMFFVSAAHILSSLPLPLLSVVTKSSAFICSEVMTGAFVISKAPKISVTSPHEEPANTSELKYMSCILSVLKFWNMARPMIPPKVELPSIAPTL